MVSTLRVSFLAFLISAFAVFNHCLAGDASLTLLEIAVFNVHFGCTQ